MARPAHSYFFMCGERDPLRHDVRHFPCGTLHVCVACVARCGAHAPASAAEVLYRVGVSAVAAYARYGAHVYAASVFGDDVARVGRRVVMLQAHCAVPPAVLAPVSEQKYRYDRCQDRYRQHDGQHDKDEFDAAERRYELLELRMHRPVGA